MTDAVTAGSGPAPERAAKLWRHRNGDRYVTAPGRIIGMVDKWEAVYDDCGTYDSLAEAISRGFDAIDCDDFSIGAVRGGVLVARLWMNEVVDDEPSELVEMAEWLGLKVQS